MRTKLIDLLLVLSMCAFWGCASSKAIDIADAGTQPAVDTQQEQPAIEQSQQQKVTKALPNEDRSWAAPAKVPKAKPSNVKTGNEKTDNVKTINDVAVQPKNPPINETPKVAEKNETSEHKPVEMKVANEFERNPYLATVVKSLLPPRTSVIDAAMGFKNQRQFIAAVHVSRNLNIPFNQIKTRMTAEHRMSLNDSLRDIRPDMTKNLAKAEVNKADEQAKDDENLAKELAKKAAAQAKLASNRKS